MVDRKASDAKYRATHKVEIAERHKNWHQRLKREVLNHYSQLNLGYPVCGCCQETDLAKLSIDHMAGGGRAHRKALNRWSSTAFYRWLKQQGYPTGYQTLCIDCNSKKKRWDKEYGCGWCGKKDYQGRDALGRFSTGKKP